MISPLGFLSLFSAVVATSYALSCMQCSTPSSTTCIGNSTACPSGFQCGSIYTETISSAGATSTDFTMTCVYQSECDFRGNIDVDGYKIRKAYICCSTDNCTPLVPTLLPNSSETNGLVCPSCESNSVSTCNSSVTVNCTGNNNKCLSMTKTVTGEISRLSVLKGCATKSFCDLGSYSYTFGETINITLICPNDQTTVANPTGSNGGISVQTTATTPTNSSGGLSVQTTATTPTNSSGSLSVQTTAATPTNSSGGLSVQTTAATPTNSSGGISVQTTATTPTNSSGGLSVQTTAATPATTRSSGGISAQKVILTPAVVCLLLLKWLF